MLDNATLAWQSRPAAVEALRLFELGGVDFPDCLIVALAGSAGCEAVATFDQGMCTLPKLRLLQPGFDAIDRVTPIASEVGDMGFVVNGNWRMTFTFEGEDAFLVDYQDYHWEKSHGTHVQPAAPRRTPAKP